MSDTKSAETQPAPAAEPAPSETQPGAAAAPPEEAPAADTQADEATALIERRQQKAARRQDAKDRKGTTGSDQADGDPEFLVLFQRLFPAPSEQKRKTSARTVGKRRS